MYILDEVRSRDNTDVETTDSFPFPMTFRPVLGPTQPPTQWALKPVSRE
jgi:hypothetical protein